MLFRIVAGAFALGLLSTASTASDDKNPAVTIWERESNGVNLTFEMGKKTLRGAVLSGDNGFVATCNITIDREGLVKAKVTVVEEKGNFPNKPKVGLEFSFKRMVKCVTAVLSGSLATASRMPRPSSGGSTRKRNDDRPLTSPINAPDRCSDA